MAEKATFGAGCFWGVEEAFRTLPGVLKTSVGYMGGRTENPSYEAVCSGETGHVEVVTIEFDPEQIDYKTLLEVFWAAHDPTQLNRQGYDVGWQYRSVIFYYTAKQERLAKANKMKQDASGRFERPIVTTVEPAGPYYLAEDYHQQYVCKRNASH